jgi:RNA polymerase sporulation-specific sigma factor
VSLNKPVQGDGEEERPFGEALVGSDAPDPAELVISAEGIAAMRDSIGRVLSTLETEVLRLYIDGKSYQEIADALGRHVKSIDNALQRIKRKLEQFIIKEDVQAIH